MSYGFMTPPETADTQAAREAAAAASRPDPSIPWQFARQKQNLTRSMNNPFGANISPETFEAMRYARESDIDQAHGQALREDAFRRGNARFQNLYAIAGLSQPRMVQTGGTTTGTVSQPLWPGLLMGGINAGIGAAMGI